MLTEVPDIILRKIWNRVSTEDRPNLFQALGEDYLNKVGALNFKETFWCVICQMEILFEHFRLETEPNDPNDPHAKEPTLQRLFILQKVYDNENKGKWIPRKLNFNDQKIPSHIQFYIYGQMYQCYNTCDLDKLKKHTKMSHSSLQNLPPNSDPLAVFKVQLLNVQQAEFAGIMSELFTYMENVQKYADYIDPVYTRFRTESGITEPEKLLTGKALRVFAKFIGIYMNPANWNGNNTVSQIIDRAPGLYLFIRAICNVTNGAWNIHGTYKILPPKVRRKHIKKKSPKKFCKLLS